MDRRFLRYYEQELRFVRDLGGEFASSHARVANRFGLEADSCADPYVEWLLDGFAFLAARVHLKLNSEHERFTHHLLEMVYPDLLAPTPAAAIVRFEPDTAAAPLEGGFPIPRGTRLLGRIAPGDQTRCTFSTAHEVTLWPITVAEARYVTGSALGSLGLAGRDRAQAALVLRLETLGELPIAQLALDRLPLHLAGNDRIAHCLYKSLSARALGLLVRGADGSVLARLDAGAVRRSGFADDEALYPQAPLGFSGYRLLREYFTLPERFLFIELSGLNPALRRASGTSVELIISLAKGDQVLDGAVTAGQFALFATPALNLFPRRAKPILLEPHDREHHVVADRVRPLDLEIYAVSSVVGTGEDERDRHEFTPFYRTDHLADTVARARILRDRAPPASRHGRRAAPCQPSRGRRRGAPPRGRSLELSRRRGLPDAVRRQRGALATWPATARRRSSVHQP